MNIADLKQLAALRPDAAERTITNVHLTVAELLRFKSLAKNCGVNFSGLVRAALRKLDRELDRS
jgi:hypothetical protein